jgi:hypothetical protein
MLLVPNVEETQGELQETLCCTVRARFWNLIVFHPFPGLLSWKTLRNLFSEIWSQTRNNLLRHAIVPSLFWSEIDEICIQLRERDPLLEDSSSIPGAAVSEGVGKPGGSWPPDGSARVLCTKRPGLARRIDVVPVARFWGRL